VEKKDEVEAAIISVVAFVTSGQPGEVPRFATTGTTTLTKIAANTLRPTHCLTTFFKKENALILAHYTGLFTDMTQKRKITQKFKTPVHLPQAFIDLFVTTTEAASQSSLGSPQGGGRIGGLTSRRTVEYTTS
jgi:hypothetical protein